MGFLWALEDRGDRRFLLSRFGRTPEGRELPLVVASKGDVMTPDDARRSGRPIVLVINGIHAGEVEGKEASMMLLRDLLDGEARRPARGARRAVRAAVQSRRQRSHRSEEPRARHRAPHGADRSRRWRRHAHERVRHQPQPRLPAPGSARDAAPAGARVPHVAAAPDDRLPRDERLGPPLRDDVRHAAHRRERHAPSRSPACASSCCRRCASGCGSARGSRASATATSSRTRGGRAKAG